MTLIETVNSLQRSLQGERDQGKSIGFVPTMGALHEGHASLVRHCVSQNDVSVVSVFVNPTQFNNPDDLLRYPRTPEEDYRLLEHLGVDYVFAPSVDEMYPQPDTRVFNFGALERVMEGAFRPGHFNGVALVVSKLFEYVQPDVAYFGEKDFQQLAIVKAMVDQLNLPVQIIGVETVREPNGLALSSRNKRLTDDERERASSIYRVLKESTRRMANKALLEVVDWVTGQVNNVPGLRVEYYDIVDAQTLQTVTDWQEASEIVGCIAVYCGDVRLIDNIRYK